MSGTASRFQGRFGYAPGLTLGAYPARAPSLLPAVDAPPSAPAATLPAAPAAPAPAPQASTPVSAGSVPMGEQGQGSAGTGFPGLGNNPGNLGGMLGGGPNGLGTVSYGTIGGALGTLAGAALGVPGLGALGGGIGGYLDARDFNGQIASMGYEPTIDERAAAINGATLGLAGTNPQMAFDNFMGAIGHDFGPTDAFNGATVSENTAGGGDSKDSGTPGEAGVSDGMFMSGGYTGPGHPAEPAGTVHRGEVVIPAAQVARYGLSPLLAIAEGAVAPSRLAALARG